MTAKRHSAPPATAVPPGAAVVWLFDPWRERPRIAALASVSALGMCALVLWARLPFVLATAMCVASVAAFAPALAAVECRIDDAGAARRGLLGWERRSWEAVRRVDRVQGGALLSPYLRPHALDFTRALLLPMPDARRAELLSVLAERKAGRRA